MRKLDKGAIYLKENIARDTKTIETGSYTDTPFKFRHSRENNKV